MEVCGIKVVVRRTFLEVDASQCSDVKRRSATDPCVCGSGYDSDDVVSTVADSAECLSRWGCEELDFDLADASTCAPSSVSSPMSPPGIFSPVHSTVSSCSSGPSLLTPQRPSASKRNVVHCPNEKRATLMLRNLPSSFTQERLLDVLDTRGLLNCCDFVYLPVDFQSGAGLGYAFVNMSSCDDAKRAMVDLVGFNSWGDVACKKVLDVCWSDPHQGLDMLIDRYRNSRVMHRLVPDHYKPFLMENGKKIVFPVPTKRVRSPL